MPLRVVLGGTVIAQTDRAFRVCETHHAPTYYFPPDAIREGALTASRGVSYCEWKGHAAYWDVTGGATRRRRAAWSYPDPSEAFAPLRDHVAFYCSKMDDCLVDDERVTPQPGDFYGGWVTPNLSGTVKGGPGTRWW